MSRLLALLVALLLLPPASQAKDKQAKGSKAEKSNRKKTGTPGPSGRKSTKKYLDKRWENTSFGAKKKAIDYHVDKHCQGLTAAECTRRAARLFDDRSATRKSAIDRQGRAAVKVSSPLGEGLFTKQGKIIWFEPRK